VTGPPDPGSSGPGVARLAAGVPARHAREVLLSSITTYFSSFGAADVETRIALFADEMVFEDPAGRHVASDVAGLRAFWVEKIPPDWKVAFTLERAAIVGDEALATATMHLRAGEKSSVDVLVNCHFAFDQDGRIVSFRAFFDEQSIVDSREG